MSFYRDEHRQRGQRQCEKMEKYSGDSPNSGPWELPEKSKRVNMTTVGVTRGPFPLDKPPLYTPSE